MGLTIGAERAGVEPATVAISFIRRVSEVSCGLYFRVYPTRAGQRASSNLRKNEPGSPPFAPGFLQRMAITFCHLSKCPVSWGGR